MIGPWYVTTDSKRRQAWGPPCQPDLAPIVLDGRTYQCDRSVVPAFKRWEQIRARWNYGLPGTDTGFYNCRHMRFDPDLPYSVHAWARALDENWLQNPAGDKLVTDMPTGMILELEQIKTNSGAFVFVWGGDWDRNPITGHTYYDAMHWELVAHPLDLETGIAGLTEEGGTMIVKEGERGNYIKVYQTALNAWAAKDFVPNWTTVAVDGIFGPGLRAAVQRYQEAAQVNLKVPQLGALDDLTRDLLERYVER